MDVNSMPKMDMDTSETKCCPKFDPQAWDGLELVFEDKPFVKANTMSILHFPLNMGSMYKRVWGKVEKQGAAPNDYYLVMSIDPSPWKGEHYFAVEKEVEGEENVKLSGKFLTKVFEGPYQDAGKWHGKMAEYVKEKGKTPKRIYFFYTTCPKCAKHWGKNYSVALAEI